MREVLILATIFAAQVAAQTSETVFFRAKMLPSNEIPAVNFPGSAAAVVAVHLMRNDAGEIVSGTVDFNLGMRATGAQTYTGLHIHRGRADENGPVTINSGMSMVQADGPRDLVFQGQVPPDNANGVATLRGMMQNASDYYINVHTTEFPAGAARAQLERAEMIVLGGMMSPRNENPALPESVGFGRGMVIAIASRNEQGQITGGAAKLMANFRFGEQVNITGFHIHEGSPAVNGPVTINSGLTGQTPSQADGSGSVTSLNGPNGFVDVDMTNAAQARTLIGLFTNPENFYINVHTTVYTGGAIRAPLRRTERLDIPFIATPAAEVPAISGLNATAIGSVSFYLMRAQDGSVEWAAASFDANYRFPGEITLTGMHVHEGASDVAGPVRFDSAMTRTTSATGFGNLYQTPQPLVLGDLLALVEKLLRDPAGFYFNVHTADNPTGACRAQLAQASSAAPVIGAIVASNLDPAATTLAPGSLFTIYGRNLSKLAGTLAGWQGRSLPEGLNSVAVGLGALRARLLYVSPTQINAQLPFETPAGAQAIAVNNGSATSAAASVRVAAAAPAVFLVVKALDFSPVTPSSPASAGELLIVASTGLGATSPPLATGDLAPADQVYNSAPATVTVAGENARVVGSAALPGFAGVYITGFTVPQSATAGARPLVLSVGGASSNPFPLAIR